jgi:hypothetical protein
MLGGFLLCFLLAKLLDERSYGFPALNRQM